MTLLDREKLLAEQSALMEKINHADFIDPADMKRRDEITSLLLTDGADDNLRLSARPMRKSHRVTSFTRDRR